MDLLEVRVVEEVGGMEVNVVYASEPDENGMYITLWDDGTIELGDKWEAKSIRLDEDEAKKLMTWLSTNFRRVK